MPIRPQEAVPALPTRVHLFNPFPGNPEIVFGRIAARSPAFGRNPAAGGDQVVVGSAAGRSEESVVPRTRGELFERAANIIAGRTAEGRATVASFSELRRAGRTALDPASWHGSGGAEDREFRLQWVNGECLLTGEPTLVPAGAVFLQHRSPTVINVGSTGLAAHHDHDSAVRHALLETLERDLVWRAWYGVGADVPDGRRIALPRDLEATVDGMGLRAGALLLAGPARTGCVVVCLATPEGREQAFGARCVVDSSADELCRGVEAAGYEALMLRWSMRSSKAAEIAWREWGASSQVPPRNAVEHGLAAFHGRLGLNPWSRLCRRVGRSEAWGVVDFDGGEHGGERERSGQALDTSELVDSLCEHTRSAAVVVDTTVPGLGPEGSVALRVVVPGARALPGDERKAVVPAEPGGHRPPPHPFG
ncbi:YcaO-like family protein [Saccharopolyspora taberi]|uniref:YcaO domain-containing protein n=1 Tax=Saccharopolyspora taberi TaxID=60895 RepID=A0ABN3VGD8_9PSEU